MYINSAYLNHSRVDFKDKSRPLIVGSCGTYHLYTKDELPTYRPRGRIDYQLLYVASGKAYFYFNGKERIVPAGHMVLYRPKEMQKYIYYGIDQTEVYWVHFTGSDVKRILKNYGFPDTEHVISTGSSPDYQHIFQKMIQELQLCKPHFEELLAMLLQQLFIAVSRLDTKEKKLNSYIHTEIEQATAYFNEHYNTEINIEEYAAKRHMSTSWFIRNFKQYNGITPMHYILTLRITNAQNLLETTSYNITEIAEIVGYSNPLYFSRLFKKQMGISPSEYRNKN